MYSGCFMYVAIPRSVGIVGDTLKKKGLTYQKQTNGGWALVQNKALRQLLTGLYVDQQLTLRGITEKTGIPHSSVQKALNAFNLTRKKKTMSDEDANAFCEKNHSLLVSMYQDKGMTRTSIAEVIREKTGLPFKTCMLSRYFESVGIERRTHAEAIAEATKHGRRHKIKKGTILFSKTAIQAWENNLDRSLCGITFVQYKRIVHRFTYMVVSRFPHLFPEGTHRIDRWLSGESKDIHLDHQFSKTNGYYEFNGKDYVPRKQPVALSVICHPCNLKLMAARTNMIKHSMNHIELDDLLKRIAAFEKKHGDIFDDYYGKYTVEQIVDAYDKRKCK